MGRNLRFSDEIGNVTSNRCAIIIANCKFKSTMKLQEIEGVQESAFAVSRSLSSFHKIEPVTLLNTGSNRVFKYLSSVKNDRSWECVIIYFIGYYKLNEENQPVLALEDSWIQIDSLFEGWPKTLKGLLTIIVGIPCTTNETLPSNHLWNQSLISSYNLQSLDHNTDEFIKPNPNIELEALNKQENFEKNLLIYESSDQYLSGPRTRYLISCCIKDKFSSKQFNDCFISCIQGEFLRKYFNLNWNLKLKYNEKIGYSLKSNDNIFIYFDVVQLAHVLELNSKNSLCMENNICIYKCHGHQKGGSLFFCVSENKLIDHLHLGGIQLPKNILKYTIAILLAILSFIFALLSLLK